MINRHRLKLVIGMVIALFHLPAVASLKEAYDSLAVSTSTGAEAFKTQVSNGINLGSTQIRYGVKSIQLVTYEPMSLSAGCSGISAHFGAVSFVNGDEIEQMIAAVAQNAKGYVLQLVLSELCGICQTIIETVNKTMETLSQGIRDSCAMAKNLVNGLANYTLGSKETCNENSVTGNKAADYFQAEVELCADFSKVRDTLPDWMNEKSEDENVAQKEQDTSQLNTFWQYAKTSGLIPDKNGPLSDVDLKRVEIAQVLMSMVSFEIQGDAMTPTIEDPMTIVALFVCGANVVQKQFGADLSDFCNKTLGEAAGTDNEANQIRVCIAKEGSAIPGHVDCLKTKAVGILKGKTEWDKSKVFDTGFAVLIKTELEDAVGKIAAGQGGTLSPMTKSLIAIAPFPLYKILNIAAAYPSVSNQIIGDYYLDLSILLAEAYIKKVMKEASLYAGKKAKTDGSAKASLIPIQLIVQFDEAINNVVSDVKSTGRNFMRRWEVQTAIEKRVENIEKVIYRQAYQSGILDNLNFR